MFSKKSSFLFIIFCLLFSRSHAEDGSIIVPPGDDAALMQDLEELKTELPEDEVTKTSPATPVTAEEVDKLEYLDPKDANTLSDTNEVSALKDPESTKMSSEQELQDDLDSLKSDVSDLITVDPELKEDEPKKEEVKEEKKVADQKDDKKDEIAIFDTGKEEKDLLEVAQFIQGKIPSAEWEKIAAQNKSEQYVVQEGDWLWKISKSLFGSGFYYSKIWSMNPYITNPHEIEPGMVLAFNTGTSDKLPEVQVGEFHQDSLTPAEKEKLLRTTGIDYSSFGDNAMPEWIKERKELIEKGTYFQYATDMSYEDLNELGMSALNKEYEVYDPPASEILVREPGPEYDQTGFSKESKIKFDYREGFYLNTFVTTNIVQDLGHIQAFQNEASMAHIHDEIYVKFDDGAKIKPGDLFSVYSAMGKSAYKTSDRSGYKYAVTGQIQTISKKNDLWECKVVETTGIIQRNDRITVYTPKINRIVKTFNSRNIEAIVMDSYRESLTGNSFGDVIYLDRGRADGVEIGNVFEVFSFTDRGTEKRISADPTYKIGEITIISITDNFATGLVSRSINEIGAGALAITKTAEEAARSSRLKNKDALKQVKMLEDKSLEELDVELNLNDVNEDLLEKADKVHMTEDELEELERQEREKSIIKDHERDLKELERLEKEITDAEKQLNEARVDEDKFLEQENLNELEKKIGEPDPNSFESLNEIEKEVGRKYMDEDLNAKENPYGLTEFDLEEIDELMNTGSGKK
jgi:hypothetical protein